MMITSREDVIEAIVETVNEFRKMNTNRKKIWVETLIKNQMNGSKKVFISLGIECIGHFTVAENEPDSVYYEVMKLVDANDFDRTFQVFWREHMEKHIPKNFFLLDHAVYNEDLEAIRKYTKYLNLNNISKKMVEDDFPNLVLEDGKVGNDGRAPDGARHINNKKTLEDSKVEKTGRTPSGTIQIKDRTELEKEQVEIYKQDPYTNSIAMSKDFLLIEKNIIRDINETIMTMPSLISSVFWSIYKDGDNLSKYIHIDEPMFVELLSSMPTSDNPKSFLVRRNKRMEYYNAFKNMRQWFKERGYDDGYLSRLMLDRSEGTTDLMRMMSATLKATGDGFENFKRILFNNINHKAGIDAKMFSSDIDREQLDDKIQQRLIMIERDVSILLRDLCDIGLTDDIIVSVTNYYLKDVTLTDIVSKSPKIWLGRVINDKKFEEYATKYVHLNPYKA